MLRSGACLQLCLATVSVAVLASGCADSPFYDPDVFEARKSTGWTQPLADLGIDGRVDALAEPRNYIVKQVSSYDRTGGDSDAGYAHQIYDGGVVLADLEGPGAILRLWAENPTGFLYIYVDDLDRPLIAKPFQDLFHGELELSNVFGPPLASAQGGGAVSYVPIPYQSRCRIIVTGSEQALAYQVTYAQFPPGTPIESFALELTEDDVEYFRRWRDNWLDDDIRFHDRDSERIHHSSTKIWGESNDLVFPIEGPGVITELEMTMDSFDPDLFRNVWIAIYFDGQSDPGVLAPVGHFFGAAHHGDTNYNGVVMGNVDGRMFSRYPMPFRTSAEIRVLNISSIMADFEYWITWRPMPVGDMKYFHARYNSTQTITGRPYRVADLAGDGHFVGATVAVDNAPSMQFFAGDDALAIDGRPISDFHGTGLDHYFNGGLAFPTGPYSSPISACTVKLAQTPTGFSAFRNHLTDAIPFHSSFTFVLEEPAAEQLGITNYSSVAYWYQTEKDPPKWPIAEVSQVERLLK